MDAEKLQQAGIDYEGGMKRFMGNRVIYERILKKFPQDETFSEFKKAMEAREYEKAFSLIHTLKGVSANLSLRTFYEQTCTLVELLRDQKDVEAAQAAMPAYEKAYEELVEILL